MGESRAKLPLSAQLHWPHRGRWLHNVLLSPELEDEGFYQRDDGHLVRPPAM